MYLKKKKSENGLLSMFVYLTLDLSSSSAARGTQGIQKEPPVVPHMCCCLDVFPLGLDYRIDVFEVPLVRTTKCILRLPSSSGSLWLPLQYSSGESISRHTDNMPQVAPSSLAYDICYQGLARDRPNSLVGYVVSPVNVQYSAKTVVLEGKNPLFLVLV